MEPSPDASETMARLVEQRLSDEMVDAMRRLAEVKRRRAELDAQLRQNRSELRRQIAHAREAGLSYRDIAEVLEVTRQRVQTLAKEGFPSGG